MTTFKVYAADLTKAIAEFDTINEAMEYAKKDCEKVDTEDKKLPRSFLAIERCAMNVKRSSQKNQIPLAKSPVHDCESQRYNAPGCPVHIAFWLQDKR